MTFPTEQPRTQESSLPAFLCVEPGTGLRGWEAAEAPTALGSGRPLRALPLTSHTRPHPPPQVGHPRLPSYPTATCVTT